MGYRGPGSRPCHPRSQRCLCWPGLRQHTAFHDESRCLLIETAHYSGAVRRLFTSIHAHNPLGPYCHRRDLDPTQPNPVCPISLPSDGLSVEATYT